MASTGNYPPYQHPIASTFPVTTPWQLYFNSLSGSGGGLQTQRTTLTDAQIRTLPTATVQVVPPVATGTMIIPIVYVLIAKFVSGAYTNIDPAGFANMQSTEAGHTLMSGYIGNDASTSPVLSRLTDVFGAANNWVQTLNVYNDIFTPAASQWGLLPVQWASGNLDGAGIEMFWQNNGAGNLTGGNSANSLIVETRYLVVSL